MYENAGKIKSGEVWNKLMKKYNVFHLHKPYDNKNLDR